MPDETSDELPVLYAVVKEGGAPVAIGGLQPSLFTSRKSAKEFLKLVEITASVVPYHPEPRVLRLVEAAEAVKAEYDAWCGGGETKWAALVRLSAAAAAIRGAAGTKGA